MVFVNREKKDYAQVLDAALDPMLDFDSCEYAINEITQEEFLRISDKLGSCCYLDITGMSRAQILKDVCKIVLLDQARLAPNSIITDIDKKRRVAPLFL